MNPPPPPPQSQSFVAGVGMLLLTLAVGFTLNVRRLYNMTLSKQTLTLTAEEWKEWQEEHKDHADSTSLFYERRETRSRLFVSGYSLRFLGGKKQPAVCLRVSKSVEKAVPEGAAVLQTHGASLADPRTSDRYKISKSGVSVFSPEMLVSFRSSRDACF